MRLKEFRKSPKNVLRRQVGEVSKRMPNSAFPLTHNSSFRPGIGWNWWMIEFEASGHKGRVLVTLNRGKCCYRAWLALEAGRGLVVMARLEYEPAHPNEWHCHVCCEDSGVAPSGVVRHGPSVRGARLSLGRHRQGFEVTEHNALEIALAFFGFGSAQCPPDGGLFGA